MKRYLLDTNLLVRFLTGEPEGMAERARALVTANEAGEISLRIVPLVVAEVVFVLTGRHYGHARADVARALLGFLESPTLDVVGRDTLLRALRLYRDHPIDFVDATLAAEAELTGIGVATFDRDFRRIPGLDLHEP